MWTLSGFADEIDPDLEDPVRDPERPRHHPRRVPQRLGHQRARPDRRADRRGRGAPGGARPGGVVHRLTARQDQYRGRLRRPPGPGRPGAGRRGSASAPRSSGSSPSSCARTRHRSSTATRCSDGWPPSPSSAAPTGVVLLHENEKDIYGDVPERVLDIVESVGSPALRLAWDPANYVQVGRHPVHRRLRGAPPVHRLRPDQGRAARHRRGGARGRGRRAGPRDRPRAGRRRLRRLLLHGAAPRHLQRVRRALRARELHPRHPRVHRHPRQRRNRVPHEQPTRSGSPWSAPA